MCEDFPTHVIYFYKRVPNGTVPPQVFLRVEALDGPDPPVTRSWYASLLNMDMGASASHRPYRACREAARSRPKWLVQFVAARAAGLRWVCEGRPFVAHASAVCSDVLLACPLPMSRFPPCRCETLSCHSFVEVSPTASAASLSPPMHHST